MSTATVLWLAAIAGGPIVLGLALAYGISRRRRLSRGEKIAQEDAVDLLYDRKN